LEAFDRNEAVDCVEVGAQCGGACKIVVGSPVRGPNFENDGNHHCVS